MSALIDLTGRRFGRLLVLRREGSRRYDDGFKVVPLWRCRCDCGMEVLVEGTNLRRGMTRSCGCLRRDYDRKRRKERIATPAPGAGSQ